MLSLPRYFVVLSVVLTLDLLVFLLLKSTSSPRLVSAWRLLKLFMLLWCLAPSNHYNGSDVIFDHVVGPFVRNTGLLLKATQKLLSHVGPIVLEKILENSGTVFEKVLEYSEEIYNFLECALDLLKDEAFRITECLFRGLRDLICSEIFKKTAFVFVRKLRLLGVWSKDLVLAGHSKSVELLTKGGKKEEPRLISNLVKQILYGSQEEQERPKRLISDWFRQWRSVSA